MYVQFALMIEFFSENLFAPLVDYKKIIDYLFPVIPRHSNLYCVGDDYSRLECFSIHLAVILYKCRPVGESAYDVIRIEFRYDFIEFLLVYAFEYYIQDFIRELLIKQIECCIPYERYLFRKSVEFAGVVSSFLKKLCQVQCFGFTSSLL